MDAKELVHRYNELSEDIRQYIMDTPHFIMYWIENWEVQRLIEEYPDDYEKMVSITVESVSLNPSPHPEVEISFSDHPDAVESISRSCVLITFRDTVKARWLRWGGKTKEIRIQRLQEELDCYKRRIADIEEQLKSEE